MMMSAVVFKPALCNVMFLVDRPLVALIFINER